MPEAFCGFEIVCKWVLLYLWVLWEKDIPFVREKPPQRVVCVSSHRVGAFYFSQNNTDKQNTQHFTETLSQPITQNLTAIFGSNALCSLYAEGLLWARHCAPKISVNSVRSVREKTHQREKKNLTTHHASNPIGVTSHTNSHRLLPRPLPRREGA